MGRKNVVSSSINLVSTIVYISFLLNLAIAAKPKGFSMKMIRSDSKESPLYPRYANLTQAEIIRGRAEQSKARVRHLGSARAAAYNQTSSMNPNIVPVKYVENSDFYIGEVGIGTFDDPDEPYKKLYLIIDSGTDLMWTQCPGGRNYFYQDLPFYDHKHSNTYTPIPCKDLPDQCVDERCRYGFCTYKEEYGSEQVSYGQLAYETITMDPIPGQEKSDPFEKTIMGCGFSQRNFGRAFGVPETGDGGRQWYGRPKPENALITGILGLGQGDPEFSFVLQKADHTEKRFEYCLPSYDVEGDDVSTYLRFGSDTIIGGGPEVFSTPIIKDREFEMLYHLNLEGISVNHKRLKFDQRDFDKKEDGTGGTIIDSGTPMTTLMNRFYERVEEEVIGFFNELGIDAVDHPEDGFDICFRIPENFEEFPIITFHFEGADFVIRHRSGLFVLFKDEEVASYTSCLGILSLPDEEVGGFVFAANIGAMQQSNKRISYNLRDDKLSFREEKCNLHS